MCCVLFCDVKVALSNLNLFCFCFVALSLLAFEVVEQMTCSFLLLAASLLHRYGLRFVGILPQLLTSSSHQVSKSLTL